MRLVAPMTAPHDQVLSVILDAQHRCAPEGRDIARPVAVVHRVPVGHVGEAIPLGGALEGHLEHVVVPLEVGVGGAVGGAHHLVGTSHHEPMQRRGPGVEPGAAGVDWQS